MQKCTRTVTKTTEYWISCASNLQYGKFYTPTNTCTRSASDCDQALLDATSCAIDKNYSSVLLQAEADAPCPGNEP